jgi:uncharacterized protein YggE
MDEICDNGHCTFSGVPQVGQPRGDERALAVVDQQIVVTLREPGKLGELLAQAVAAGADSIQSVAFAVGDPNALASRAREMAIADARARAEQMAAGLGVTLGPAMTIGENPGSFEQFAPFAGAGSRMHAQVTVTYRLRQD